MVTADARLANALAATEHGGSVGLLGGFVSERHVGQHRGLFDLSSRTWPPDVKHGLRTPGLLILSTVGLVWSIIGVRSVPVDEVAIATNKEAILDRARSWPRLPANSK